MSEDILLPEPCAPTASHAISTEVAATVASALKALGDPFRLRMLSAIAADPRGESCVCDLAELAEVSQPTVSHHLKVLKNVGLLDAERRGTWVWYRINPARRSAVTALLDAFAPAAIAEAAPEALPDEDPADTDAQIAHLAADLAAATPALPPETVTGIVRESYAALARSAKITRYIVPLTERFARQRLADLTRDRESAAPQVLFVCVANAGRSQLAAALVSRLSGGRVIARSAGSTPAADVHPHVRSLLAEIEGDDASQRFPKPLTDDAVRAADVVVTMGCGDVCPVIPGVRYEDWAVGDPALASPEGVAAIRDDIESRVRKLLDTLLTD
ncbi:metalloregulator ArsR/SmtB family transcription factor [Brevibacterium casei]|uniref:ArsR family transcriptional regulator n=2 Tax=Brevibacterium casei TaxID=33889 RepID=A0A2H1K623_9MICO|nr:metalloregulator ArsR/SmtB family transcription factor [Brevibacterium casei]QPR37809.1 metalloregulator ArsR/SmtB family transcription factor [Brevibacterium casei]QPR45101.1 metalloregulator ArsR/SmtB family transcription factor [Brevibacterium casei]QPS33300.1 metalloregulator ArsR/SmtB family transcription factor [Brevibacterium casei]SMX95173.1 ArsR family transcriptional regulator [Brevibacterium casei CIP 102111]